MSVPTAKEFLKEKGHHLTTADMIEFTKMHVQEALKAEQQRIRIKSKGFVDTTEEEKEILNVYPLSNIK